MQCLGLVLRGYEVKEIARELNITPNAVTERLRTARARLGARTSREAALIACGGERPLPTARPAEYPETPDFIENGDDPDASGQMDAPSPAYIRHVDMPSGLAAAAHAPPFSTASAEGERPVTRSMLEETQAGFDIGISAREREEAQARRNRLTTVQTIAIIVALMFLFAFTIPGIYATLVVVSETAPPIILNDK